MLEYEIRPIESWPTQPTTNRTSASFRATWTNTLDVLERELKHLRAKNAVLQLFVTIDQIRNDGMLRSGTQPSRPGVILSFESKHGSLAYPCDAFTEWRANVRAIALALEALRRVDRYGVSAKAEQYRGWARIESQDVIVRNAANIIGIHGGATVNQILGSKHEFEQAYLRACLASHPDSNPGQVDAFKRVQAAKQTLDRHFSKGATSNVS